MAEDGGRLDDAAVEQRLSLVDGLLGQLEQIPGRTAELALQAVEAVVDVYGEALCRVADAVADDPGARDALTADELLRHLMLLHRVHPDPPAARVGRAVDDAAAALRASGARVELVEVRDESAVVRVTSGSCGSCGDTAALHGVVRDEVLAAAPELARVDFVGAEPAPALIPLAAVGVRRAAEQGAEDADWRRSDTLRGVR
jgi:Fe-S cluster biogenesis protein NfuA